MKKNITIAIDGPSGAGKSTMAKLIAERLNIMYLDTGAMYRALGYAALQNDIDTTDQSETESFALQQKISVVFKNREQLVLVNDQDVTSEIRTAAVSMAASNVSKYPEVREIMWKLQRELARSHSFVLDGRDIGTVVLPQADCKIFLTASDEERARRRMSDLKQHGQNMSYEEVLRDLKARDKQDRERTLAPTKPAEDAVIVNSDGKSIDETADLLYDIIQNKCLLRC